MASSETEKENAKNAVQTSAGDSDAGMVPTGDAQTIEQVMNTEHSHAPAADCTDHQQTPDTAAASQHVVDHVAKVDKQCTADSGTAVLCNGYSESQEASATPAPPPAGADDGDGGASSKQQANNTNVNNVSAATNEVKTPPPPSAPLQSQSVTPQRAGEQGSGESPAAFTRSESASIDRATRAHEQHGIKPDQSVRSMTTESESLLPCHRSPHTIRTNYKMFSCTYWYIQVCFGFLNT